MKKLVLVSLKLPSDFFFDKFFLVKKAFTSHEKHELIFEKKLNVKPSCPSTKPGCPRIYLEKQWFVLGQPGFVLGQLSFVLGQPSMKG